MTVKLHEFTCGECEAKIQLHIEDRDYLAQPDAMLCSSCLHRGIAKTKASKRLT